MHTKAGYALAFNRDEQRSRLRAIPPALKQNRDGNQYIAAIDADAGGSWLMVNEFGITACLLNFYAAEVTPERARQSRGAIVLLFSGCRSLDEAANIVQQMDTRPYRGFDLVILQQQADPVQYRWNGQSLERLAPTHCLTSSSVQTEEVCAHRKQLFETTRPATMDQMLEFHRSHDGPSPAHPTCMHRSDAETVSLCLVEVSPGSVSLRYADGSPCRSPLCTQIELIRSNAPAY